MVPDQHIMQRRRVTPDGSEMWLCSSCGRRLLLRWLPDFKQIVLEPGDDTISHLGYAPGHSDAAQRLSASPLEAELLPGSPVARAEPDSPTVYGAYAFGKASAVDRFIDFGDPEVTDGLVPWIKLIERLGRDSTD